MLGLSTGRPGLARVREPRKSPAFGSGSLEGLARHERRGEPQEAAAVGAPLALCRAYRCAGIGYLGSVVIRKASPPSNPPEGTDKGEGTE
jgi:hypothetical protein